MRSVAIALAVLSASLLVPSSTVLAQELPQLGQRVRVTSGVYHRVVSTVQAISADSLVVKPYGVHEGDIRLSMAQVSLLETSVAQTSYARIGFVVGGGVGMVAGGAIGYAAADCEPTPGAGLANIDPACGLGTGLLGMVIGGALLGGIGWVIGDAILPSERWQAVPLDNISLSIVPQRDGRFTLGMSVVF